MQYSHQYWMSLAVEIAKKNVGADTRSAQECEVPVAAIIIKDNKLISKTVNQTEFLLDATAHAEIQAIKEASRVLGNWRLNGCILYTTLEPCSMCAGAILNSRISTLVFGAYDPNQGVCGSVINLFSDLNKEKQVEVIGGILELEASELLKSFFVIKR